MSEVQTPAAPQAPAAPPQKGKGPATHEQKQKRRRTIRRIIGLAVAAGVIGGGAFLLKKFVFTGKDSSLGEPLTQTVYRGSIQSTVTGMGNARAKNSAAVTPDAGYNVLELFVNEGDTVEEGQLLYNLDDSAAQEAVQTAQSNVRKAQDAVDDLNRELEKLLEDVKDLNITAPHAGKLTDVNSDIKAGDDLTEGTAVATIINDTKLRLHLYYSWAYEGQIQVGQSARINLPAVMADYPATVEQINYVRRIVPEGSVTFEVVFVMDNPGTLTEGMTASAAMTGADGQSIYPYESSTLEYYETTKLTVKVAGPVEYVSLMNYADVKAGQSLVKLGDKDQQAKIASKRTSIRESQKSVDDAVKALEDAQKKLDNYHAVSPISGRILSLGGLAIGQEVPSGAAIQIADTSTMVVDINIDERNVGYVSPGMMVDMRDQMGNYYMGVVEQVALTAKAENGVATFPATVTVSNPEGLLMSGSYMDYTFIASQSDDCLIVPIQAVKNVSLAHLQTQDGGMEGGEMIPSEGGALSEDAAASPMSFAVAVPDIGFGMGSAMGPGAFNGNGSTGTVCFVRGEGDDRAIEADPSWEIPEGFFAVMVETGLSDESNVEIKSGLNEGDEVFIGYMTDSAWG